MEQFLYLILAIAAGVVVIKLYISKVSRAGNRLTPAQAKARLDSGDALTRYLSRRVTEPVEELSAETAGKVLPQADGEILVYCRSGRRSARAARTLAALGYTRVYDFGGILSWPYETTAE